MLLLNNTTKTQVQLRICFFFLYYLENRCSSGFLYLESGVKNKDIIETSPLNNKSNGKSKNLLMNFFKSNNSLLESTNNNNVISVLKSDTISVLKPDDRFDDFFADTTKNFNNESAVQLNTDDLNRIAENAVR